MIAYFNEIEPAACAVLYDDPTGIPRASSYCQFVIRKALEAVGDTV